MTTNTTHDAHDADGADDRIEISFYPHESTESGNLTKFPTGDDNTNQTHPASAPLRQVAPPPAQTGAQTSLHTRHTHRT